MTTSLGSSLTRRAGFFLDQVFPGPHRNKRIAQALGISPDMAKLLRRGRGWTPERFASLAREHGWRFVEHVFEPVIGSALDRELLELKARLARLESADARAGHRVDAEVAPVAGASTPDAGGALAGVAAAPIAADSPR